MSTKLEKDEQINIAETNLGDPSKEELADALLVRALPIFSWNDIQNCSLVCKSWNTVMTGVVVAQAEYTAKYKAKFPKEDALAKLVQWRSKRDDKAHRQCLLLVLESQMLLRELAEYQPPPAPSTYANIREQLAKLAFGEADEQDLLDRIQALRNELVKAFMRNANVEKNQKALEYKIALLIQHRSSIFELDREKKKGGKKGAKSASDKAPFYTDAKKMHHYSNLFYLVRTEPRYFAKLAYLIPPMQQQKAEFADTIILTLYANAFSPLEEFLLLELLGEALKQEINGCISIDEFVSSDSATPMMIISYNKRKQGKAYVKAIFQKLIEGLIESNEDFGASPTSGAPKLDVLTKYCELFLAKILDTLDQLPYGFRLICKNIYDQITDRFKDNKKQLANIWRAVGYYVYYRFVGLAIVRPDDFGVVDKNSVTDTIALNLIAISKVLKALFMITTEKSGQFAAMSEWIESKHGAVLEYLKNVIDVTNAEEHLQVNKYGQLARKDKASLVIHPREVAAIHKLLSDNKDELAKSKDDPLAIILDDLGEVPDCHEDDTEINLELENRFPPVLSKLDRKKNLKQETIDDAIKILRKIPGFSGDTFLEIFVRMKLHCQKHGEEDLAKEVNQVIANLQNLAKHGLVSPKDGFNSFLKDIHNEILVREKRHTEQIKEVDRLKQAIKELEEQKVHMEAKMSDFENYLTSVRNQASAGFVEKTKKFKYKDLAKLKVINDSEIPPGQQGKVQFEITHVSAEKFDIKGKIKGLPGFQREFSLDLGTLLEAKEERREVFDTEKGLELNVSSTLLFINKYFFQK